MELERKDLEVELERNKKSYKNLEVLVIFDDNNINDYEYLKEIGKLDNRIKILKNDINLGAGFSRNLGIRKSSGKYIAVLEAEDTMNAIYVLPDGSSGTTSGNVTYKKAVARGVVSSFDGTYVFITGKGTGEFVTVNKPAKGLTRFGDSQLDTAQKKFGTASRL